MLARRQFVTSTLAAGMALASQKATAQPAKRTIVDAQVHLWKTEEDWRVLGMKPQMPEPFTIEKLVPLMDQAGVDRVVVVPPGDRNDYALEAAKRYPNRFAVMGRIPLKTSQAAALLPKWKEQPGMLGVRLTDSAPDWFWSEAEKAGLQVSPYSVNWDTTTATNGSHILTARARDAAGNATTSAQITVTVANTERRTGHR